MSSPVHAGLFGEIALTMDPAPGVVFHARLTLGRLYIVPDGGLLSQIRNGIALLAGLPVNIPGGVRADDNVFENTMGSVSSRSPPSSSGLLNELQVNSIINQRFFYIRDTQQTIAGAGNCRVRVSRSSLTIS